MRLMGRWPLPWINVNSIALLWHSACVAPGYSLILQLASNNSRHYAMSSTSFLSAPPATVAPLTHNPATTILSPAPQHQHQSPRNAFVLNWEDVLAPMSWLHERIGLRPSRQALATAQALFASEPYLQQALSAIEAQLIELLRIASAMGPTYVVTERSLNYMEVTCASFFPSLALWLRTSTSRVRVLAAPRTKFSSEMEKAAWRVDLLQRICRDAVARNASPDVQQRMLRSPEFGTLGLIQVSACEMDTLACVKAIDVAPFLLLKCVHLQQQQQQSEAMRLSLEKFFAQLQMLQRYVVSAAAHASAFAVNL